MLEREEEGLGNALACECFEIHAALLIPERWRNAQALSLLRLFVVEYGLAYEASGLLLIR